MICTVQRVCAAVFVFSLIISTGVSVSGAAEERDALWYAYETGPPERQKLLAQAQKRLQAILEKAGQSNGDVQWSADKDFQWITAHRTPGRLVVEKALKNHPRGASLKVLVLLTRHLESRRLTRHLPDLAFRSRSMETRRLLFETMASVGDEKCRETLRKFLGASDHSADEQLLCSAAEGLAATKNKKYIPPLKKAYGLVESEAAKLRVSIALHKCGDPKASKEVVAILKETKKPEIKIDAFHFLARNPAPGAAQIAAQYAADSPDLQIAGEALDALITMTGYGRPENIRDSAKADTLEPEKEPKGGGTKSNKPDMPHPPQKAIEKMSEQERKEIVQKVLRWSKNHPDAGIEASKKPANPVGTVKAPH